ncbi:MAG: metallophosphoesterase [Vulcanimicrobiota bacterium]
MNSLLILFTASAIMSSEELWAVFWRYTVLIILTTIIGFAVYVLLKAAALRLIWKKKAEKHRMLLTIAAVIVISSIIAIFYALFVEPDWVTLCHYRVTTSKWRNGRNVRIAQLSDLHTEKGCELRFSRALDIIRRQKPDLIVLTGDYCNDSEPATDAILRSFASDLVKTAPVYAVEGNWDTLEDMQILENQGVCMLRNEKIDLDIRGNHMSFIGSDSFRYDLLRKLLKADPSRFLAVISHTPFLFEESAALGADLYLCGHTHGGQFSLPLFGTICPYYDIVGKYQLGKYHRGSTLMIVNGGLGMEGGSFTLRFRFGVRPAVGLIEIEGK